MPNNQKASIEIEVLLREVKNSQDVFKRLEKEASNTGIGDKLSQEFETAKQSIASLSNEVGKLQKDNGANGITALSAKVDVLSKSVEKSYGMIDGLIQKVSELSGQDLGGLQKQLSESKNAIKSLSVDSLKQTLTDLKSVMKLLNDVENSDGFSVDTTGLKKKQDYLEALNKAAVEYYDLSEKINEVDGFDIGNTNKDVLAMQKQLIALGDTISKIANEASSKFDKTNWDKQIVGGFTLDGLLNQISEEFNIITENITKQKANITEQINSVNAELSKIGQAKNTTGSEGGISTALHVSTTAKGLASQAKVVIDRTNKILANEPLEVPLQFTTAYATNKVKSEIAEIRKSINKIDDDEIKAKLNNMIDHVSGSLTNEIKLNVTTNFDDKEQAIQNGIKELKEEAKKIELSPTISITEDQRASIQEQINRIARGLVLTVDDINIGSVESGVNEATGDVVTKATSLSKALIELKQVLRGINSRLDKSINANNVNTVGEASKRVAESVQAQSEAFKQGEAEIGVATSKEIINIQSMRKGVQQVTEEVNNKTEAFKNEETVVDSIVGNEISALEQLRSILTDITTEINSISSNGSININFNNLQNAVTDLSKITSDWYNVAHGFDAADSIIRENRGYDYNNKYSGELERNVLVNTQTLQTSNPFLYDKNGSTANYNRLRDYIESYTGKQISELYDLMMHTHPVNQLKSKRVTGSDLSFSYADIAHLAQAKKQDKISKTGIQSNGKIQIFDSKDLSASELSKFASYYKKRIDDVLNKKEYINNNVPNGEKPIYDLDKRSQLSTQALQDALNDLAKDLKRKISTDINDYLTQMSIDDIPKQQSPISGNRDSDSVSGEVQDFTALKDEINSVSDAIRHKTELIEAEKTSVNTNVSSEIDIFKQLLDVLKEITANIAIISKYKIDIGLKQPSNGASGGTGKNPSGRGLNNAKGRHIDYTSQGNIDDLQAQIQQAIAKNKGSSNDLAGLNQLNNEINAVTQSAKKNGKEVRVLTDVYVDWNRRFLAIKDNIKMLDILSSHFDELNKYSKSYIELSEKVTNNVATPEEVERLKQIQSEYASILALVQQLATLNPSIDINALTFDNQNNFLQSATDSYIKAMSKQNSKYANIIASKQQTKDRNGQGYSQEYNAEIETAKQNIEKLNKFLAEIRTNGIATPEQIQQVHKLNEEIGNTVKNIDNAENVTVKLSQVYKLQDKITKRLNDSSGMPSNLKSQYEALEEQIRATIQPADVLGEEMTTMTKLQFNGLTSDFAKLEAQLYKTGKTGKSLSDIFRDNVISRSMQDIAKMFSVYDLIQYGRQAFEVIKECNSAMVELRKVSNASAQDITNSFSVMAKTATELGSSVSDMISLTADWSRLGMAKA